MDQQALNGQLFDAIDEEVHDLEAVKYCIENGANKERKGIWGMTALSYAVHEENLEIVQYLIEKGSNKETTDNKKRTPLLHAVSQGNVDITKYLIKVGCNKEAKNKDGWTPLLMAARIGNIEIITFLQKQGSDITTKDLVGRTAYHLAVMGNGVDVLQWLTDHRWCNPLELTYKGSVPFDFIVDDSSNEWIQRKKENMIAYLKNVNYRIGQDVDYRQIGTTPIRLPGMCMSDYSGDDDDEDGALSMCYVSGRSDEDRRMTQAPGESYQANGLSHYSGDVNAVTPRQWMSFFNTIDSELPSKFKWINANGFEFERTENDYLNMLNDGSLIMSGFKDSGIYQLVRTLETGRKDEINVVLHVKEHRQKIFMEVHPKYWKTNGCDKPPSGIKQQLARVKDVDDLKQVIQSVKWERRQTRFKPYILEGENSLRMGSYYTGEHRCTVKLDDEIQHYFFVLQSLQEETTEKTGDTPKQERPRSKDIVGVPSVLGLKEKFLYFAYGSNLLKQRLLLNNKSAEYYTIAKLKHYKLDFIAVRDPETSKWNGGVANITQSDGEYVYGTVWKMHVEDIPSLNRQEGFYKAVDVVVKSDEKGPLKCRTYLVESNVPRSDQWDHKPSYLYKAVIINGAVESRLNQSYIDRLLKIEVNNYSGPVAAVVKPTT